MSGVTTSFRDARWLGFFALILVSWVLLLAMSTAPPPTYGLNWLDILAEICSATTGDSGFLALYAMWALMAAAMMAPSFAPALKTYDDLIHAGAGTVQGFVALICGYLSVWLLYALFGALAQWQLSEQLSPGAIDSLWLHAGLLLVAGLYQFSSLKNACLNRCRAPLTFYLAYWRDGAGGAFTMGLRLGLICVGCCWALMLLALIGGAMTLVWMGAATVLMTVEKLPQPGRYLTQPLGLILIFAAALFAGRAIALTL